MLKNNKILALLSLKKITNLSLSSIFLSRILIHLKVFLLGNCLNFTSLVYLFVAFLLPY